VVETELLGRGSRGVAHATAVAPSYLLFCNFIFSILTGTIQEKLAASEPRYDIVNSSDPPHPSLDFDADDADNPRRWTQRRLLLHALFCSQLSWREYTHQHLVNSLIRNTGYLEYQYTLQ
jgi:hypothetical protein